MNSIPGSAVFSRLAKRRKDKLAQEELLTTNTALEQRRLFYTFFIFIFSLFFIFQYEYVVQIRLHRARTYPIICGCFFFLLSVFTVFDGMDALLL